MVPKSIWGLAVALALAAIVVVCLAIASEARAATPGELLQKAIYTEETVGNLDEAIKLYEQVIASGKAGQEAAAQAQYRLALCHLKKGNDAAAKAAFESLIKNFPTATDLVAKARKHLPDALKLLPTPWELGERALMEMKLPTGLNVGAMIYMVDAAKHNGRDVTQCSARGLVTLNDASSYSSVLCETDSFRPLTSFWKHALLGEATAVYDKSSVSIDILGRKDPVTIDFTPPAFDNEQGVELFRRLPLEVGYKSTITIVPTLTATKLELGVEVPSKETITVPAGTFECYKLVLNIGQTFWISNDEHRYLVRFAAGGVTADLMKVWQAEPGKPETVAGNNFSLTLPTDWLSFTAAADPSDANASRVLLLDPRADANSELTVKPSSTLKPAERESTKVWTESFIGKLKTVLADFKLRESGIAETTVSGHPASRFVADYTQDGKKGTMVGVAVIGDDTAATVFLQTSADKFDELETDFDVIVKSLQLKK